MCIILHRGYERGGMLDTGFKELLSYKAKNIFHSLSLYQIFVFYKMMGCKHALLLLVN